MRKIQKTEALNNRFADYQKTLFDKRSFKKPIEALKELLNQKKRSQIYNLNENLIDLYLNKIIDEYDSIILADIKKMDQLIKEFERIIPAKKITKPFSEDIIDSLNYNALREKEFITLIQELGIKTCVYCHAQLTIVVNKDYYERNYKDLGVKKGDVRTLKAFLELDHKHPKSKYPFLATSFYNLYPVCGNCNKAKSDISAPFELYSESNDLDLFKFSLDEESIIQCLTKKDYSLLEIKIIPLNISNLESETYLGLFSIKEIYDTQKDIIEELLHKKIVYSNKYKKELLDVFESLFPDQSMLDRFIIGNYDQPEDSFKRPMAKFVQDIAYEIDLIKKKPKH